MKIAGLALCLLVVSSQYHRYNREERAGWASRFGRRGDSRLQSRVNRYSRRNSAFRRFWTGVFHHMRSHSHHNRRSHYHSRHHHSHHVAHRATRNIVQVAQATADLSTLVSAVVEAQLAATLSGAGPFTVFAPTNEAFARLPAATLRMLLEPANRSKLQAILEYHVIRAKVTSAQLRPFQEVTTVEGQTLDIRVRDGHVYVGNGGAQVTTANVKASNGVVHIIDRVLIPPTRHQSHSHHVARAKNIVQLAQATPDLSTLVQAVVAASLVKTLSGPGPFTVFAPTNEAFAALPQGTLQHLLRPENKRELQAVLEYHVISGAIRSTDLQGYQDPRTVEGSRLDIAIRNGRVYVGDAGAEVTTANVIASNGVVHIINEVLLPPTPSPPRHHYGYHRRYRSYGRHRRMLQGSNDGRCKNGKLCKNGLCKKC